MGEGRGGLAVPEGRGAGAEHVHGVHGSVAGLQGSSSCPELCWVPFREDPMSPVKRTDKASRERSTVPRSASSRRSVSSRLSPGLCRSVRARGQPPTCGQLHWAKAVAVTFAPSQDCLHSEFCLTPREDLHKEKGKEGTRPHGSRESGVRLGGLGLTAWGSSSHSPCPQGQRGHSPHKHTCFCQSNFTTEKTNLVPARLARFSKQNYRMPG